VTSQLPVVWLRHEVHYEFVWVYTETSAVLTAVVTDFFFNCWCLETRPDNRIRHVPRYIVVYNVACSAEYRSAGTIVPKELGKGISAVTAQQVASQLSGAHAASNMEISW
jgi:hypothetical protein